MDKLIEKLDDIFARYNVAEEDIKAEGEEYAEGEINGDDEEDDFGKPDED